MNSSLKLSIRSSAANLLYHSRLLSLLSKFSNTNWRILTYHRVVEPENSALPLQPGMFVTPETFRVHMRYLASECSVISLATLCNSVLANSPLPDKTVAVTFDDGWIDTFTTARPIMKQFGLKATVFLPTAYIGTRDLFWSDKIAYAIQTLIAKKENHQRIRSLLEQQDKAPANSKPSLSSLPVPVKRELLRLLSNNITKLSQDDTDLILETLKTTPAKERKEAVDVLRDLAKDYQSSPRDRLMMRWEEVKTMADEGFEFGSHSHNHLNMTELSTAQMHDEVVTSSQILREHLPHPASTFCYPGGYYNSMTQNVLQNSGVRQAVLAENTHFFPGLGVNALPPLFGRINIHEDITTTTALFAARVWLS